MDVIQERKLSGKTRFVDDLSHKNMLIARTVRSTIASGAITGISVPKAPDGCAIITAADVPGDNALEVSGERMPVLADGHVSYIGQPVVLLAARDPGVLSELEQRIDIHYEETPPRFSPVQPASDHILLERTIQKGDVGTAMQNAFQVLEGEYTTGPEGHHPIDHHGAFAVPRRKRLVVFSSTQWPFHVRDTLCRVLDRSPGEVSVEVPSVGQASDTKLWFPSLVAAHAGLLAAATNKPVKLVYTRDDEFYFSPKKAPSHVHYRTGVGRNGEVVAMDVTVDLECGAYQLFGQELLDRLCLGAAGLYRCENVRIQARAVRTNKPPMGANNGFGLAQGFFASELHASRIAELSQTDLYHWKLDNLIASSAESITCGSERQDLGGRRCLERVVEHADFSRKYAAYELLKKRRTSLEGMRSSLRGIGLAVCFQGNGFMGRREEQFPTAVHARLDKQGQLTLSTGFAAESAAVLDHWRTTAGGILGIAADDVSMTDPDTTQVPDAGPATLSRKLTIISRLVELSCQAIQRKRFRNPLPIEARRSHRIPRSVQWDEEAFTGTPFANLSWGAFAVEVEMDPVTLEMGVRGIWAVVDGGRIIDETLARSRIEAGILQALDWVSGVELSVDQGRVRRLAPPGWFRTLYEFVPRVHISFLQYAKKSPVKGIGELPHCGIPAAYASAVGQVTGAEFTALPITPLSIHRQTEGP
jgi:CO/xanthine dehydrogenase Mo-binding subunit